jgi:hypothetical protein
MSWDFERFDASWVKVVKILPDLISGGTSTKKDEVFSNAL